MLIGAPWSYCAFALADVFAWLCANVQHAYVAMLSAAVCQQTVCVAGGDWPNNAILYAASPLTVSKSISSCFSKVMRLHDLGFEPN